MASKREEQMAAKYAEVVERNKQLERQNAEYAAELTTLRDNASAIGSASITRDELKQMLSEILLSENESLKITNELIKVTDKNIRNTYDYFLNIAQGEYFREFCKCVNIFKDAAVEYIRDLGIATKELAETATFNINPAIEDEIISITDKVVDGVAERFKKALIEGSDQVLENIQSDKACISLSGTAATLLLITLIFSVGFLFLTMAYNYLFWHCETLFKMQYWLLGIILVPMFATLAYKLRKHRLRD